MEDLLNNNPIVLEESQLPQRSTTVEKYSSDIDSLRRFTASHCDEDLVDDDDTFEPIDNQEVFDLIKHVHDPEHPLTLAQLAVVSLDRISINDTGKTDTIAGVHIEITPTITHCSLATLIGLGLRVRLDRSLSPRFRTKITVTPGSHQSESQVNKQLNDKERVAAACENSQLLKVVEDMLAHC
ncbi:iron-sulfur cluster assembly protein [Starmerella bacillaris]|uniref:Iron-sulfur cluster assembly protein n=1 Tax=Starmerella bacillaris TaxID=1247836 RepID=A0AAV5RNP2_STABA|nr:iron-sulfur cluster assembly protein [Starmerella bacillaris]